MDYKILDRKEILNILPDRREDAHKGDFGRVLLICGSIGYTGAAYLASMGALRCGSGLVYTLVPKSVYPIVAGKLNEAIVMPVEDCGGKISTAALKQIARMLPKMDAVLVGPGMGVCEGTSAVVRFLLESYQGTLVLDADGINALKPHMDILRGRTSPTVLTPHEGEFCRLTGEDISDRKIAAEAFVQTYGATLVLKGHNTLTVSPEGGYLNNTGNPGMAVGGSGDVLAGMITAFLGQKIPTPQAAAAAVWLHGAAADACAKEFGQYAMLPTDYLQYLPRLLK